MDPYQLHVLTLALWGLDQGAEGEWPGRDSYVLEDQANLMLGWAPENALAWLVSNPNGPDEEEQAGTPERDLQKASSPQVAAGDVLSVMYSRMQSDFPSLQPAASELS